MQRLITISLLVLLAGGCTRQPEARPPAEDLPTPQAPGESAESVVTQLQSELSFWRRHTQRDPQSHIGWTNISMRCLSLARVMGGDALYVEAATAARESLRIFARPNPDAQACLAMALAGGHHFREARDLMDSAISESPHEAGLYGIRGDAHFGLGNYELADKDYRAMHKAKPSFASLTRLAAVSFVFGDSGHARALYEEAAENSAGIGREPAAWARLMVGVQELKLERYGEARAHFAESLRMAPDYFLAMEHIAETLEAEGRDEDARPYLETAIAIQRDPGLLDRLADMNERAGRHQSAKALREESLQILEKRVADGGDGHLRALAESLMDRETDLPRALALAERDLEIRRDLNACCVMARALRLNGRAKDAAPYVTEMLRYKTPDKELWDEAEAVYQQAGLPADWLRDNRPFA